MQANAGNQQRYFHKEDNKLEIYEKKMLQVSKSDYGMQFLLYIR